MSTNNNDMSLGTMVAIAKKYGSGLSGSQTTNLNKIPGIEASLDTIALLSDETNISININKKKTIKLPSGIYNIDLIVPDNIILIGDGDSTIIKGNVIIGSNCLVRDLKIGYTGKTCTLNNNCVNTKFINVTFSGGADDSRGSFWVNDKSVSNIYFEKCKFVDGDFNGVTLVDKGTDLLHIENIYFDNCLFKDNKRMNIECLVRKSAGDIVNGYKNIVLRNCDLLKTTRGTSSNINVSFDSNALTQDSSVKPGGYSIVDSCNISGGDYCLEIAGASNMTITNNKIKSDNNTICSVSVSGLRSLTSNHKIKGNTIDSYKPLVIQGNNNVIEGNIFSFTVCTFSENNNSIISNNIFMSDATAIPILFENSKCNIFSNNVLKFPNSTHGIGLYYTETKNNTITNNTFVMQSKLTHQYNLGALRIDNISNNFDHNGIIIDRLNSFTKKYYIRTTSTDLFKIISTETTTQTPCILTCKWFGTYNNNTIGGTFTMNFGKYNSKGSIPQLNIQGSTVTVTSVDNGDGTWTYQISTTNVTACVCNIDILSEGVNINNFAISS